MSKKQGKVGSPQSISDKELNHLLEEFLKKNPLNKLNPNQLEKQTGVGRQIWRRRMGDKIANLKTSFQADLGGKGSNEYVPFPNIAELVDTHWNNKKEMIASFQMYEETIQKFYEDAKAYHKHKDEVSILKKKVEKLQEELKLAKSDVQYYKEELRKVSILSLSPTERTKHDLNNVLDLKEKSNENKALSTDFAKNFPGLFGK